MQKLYSLRETFNNLISQNNLLLRATGKFLLTMCMILSTNHAMGTPDVLVGKHVVILMSLVCAFVPFSYSYAIFIIFVLCHLVSYSADVILLFLIAVVLFYALYSRSFGQYGYIAEVTFILLPTPLAFVVPLFAGSVCGTAAIAPMTAGVVIYYFAGSLAEGLKLFETATGGTQLYQCVINVLLDNRKIVICLIASILTALIVRRICSMKANYSWYLAIPVAGLLNCIIYLYGYFVFELNVNVAAVVIEAFISVILMELVQLFRGIIDYTRTEILEFEDDDYFYYVKAVPKVKYAEENVAVKTISRQKRHGLLRRDRDRHQNRNQDEEKD